MQTKAPPSDTLTERQVRGADCVFCGVTLTAETAVDLGARARQDGDGQWFPRSCGAHPGPPGNPAPARRPIPAVHELTHSQRKGWACVWCGVTLDEPVTGAHLVGTARGRHGAHILDCQAWACTKCKKGQAA